MDRRLFLCAAGMALSQCLISRWSNAQEGVPNDGLIFYAGRSGRFGYMETPKVIIGGLLAPQGIAKRLEAELEVLARDSNFNIPLHFSTNKYNLHYFQKAINAMFAQHGVVFTGVRIAYPSWPSERAVREYWRIGAETGALTGITPDKPFRICTLKHDFDTDKRIYASVSEALPAHSSFKIYLSTAQSPRMMQLSGLLVKCLNSPERLKSADSRHSYNGNSHKNALVRKTFAAFGLNGLNNDINIERDGFTLRNIQF